MFFTRRRMKDPRFPGGSPMQQPCTFEKQVSVRHNGFSILVGTKCKRSRNTPPIHLVLLYLRAQTPCLFFCLFGRFLSQESAYVACMFEKDKLQKWGWAPARDVLASALPSRETSVCPTRASLPILALGKKHALICAIQSASLVFVPGS